MNIPLANGATLLLGHTSPETALVVLDYPYSFTLRCKIRYWLEYRKGRGFRLVSQTAVPNLRATCSTCDGRGEGCSRCAGTGEVDVWNKPKPTTYAPLAVMIQQPANAKGIRVVTRAAISAYHIRTQLSVFLETYGAGLGDENSRYVIRGWEECSKDH